MVVVLAVVWSLAVGYVVHSQLPKNAIELPFERDVHLAMVVFAPEGWAFFTKDPREPAFVPYAPDRSGIWRSVAVGSYDEPRHLFGASRTPRAQGVEMGLLASQVSGSAWETCSSRVEDCLRSAQDWLVAANPSPAATLCGKIAIVRQEPLPWAWAAARDSTIMPSSFVRIDSRC